MDINLIRGDIQKLVAVNASRHLLTVYHVLGLIGAYMLKNNPDLCGWEKMELFLKFLRRECFKGKKQSIISNSSFSECTLYIHTFLLSQSFAKMKEALTSLELKIITEIDDNGYLSYNDKTFNVYASQEKIDGKLASNYIIVDLAAGSNSAEANDAKIDSLDIETGSDTIDEHKVVTPERPISQTPEVNPCKQNNSNDNSPFIQLYDVLLSKDSERRKAAKYVWQWFLTLEEYNSIKKCFKENQLPTPRKWDNKTVRLLALYIGEFYKREYDDNNKALFAQFGENSPNFKFRHFDKICDSLKIEPYRKDNQAHLFTLYVNGGLPIHYISTKLDDYKTNSLIDGLSKLLDTEDDIDKIEGEESLERVNTALRGSYHNGHSIYKYIQTLLLGKETWNDLDNDSSDFRDFKEKIREANKKATERKKFKLFYTLWTYIHDSCLKEFSLKPQIRFNPENEGERHYALSSRRIANWGITNPPAQFSLRFGDEEMNFTICCNGDYISWDMADRIDLPILSSNLTPNDLLHSDLKIVFDRLNGETFPIQNDTNLPFKAGFLQFYTDDDPSMALWNSYKGSKSFLWSGLLYDKNRYHLLSTEDVNEVNDDLGWVPFSDCISLEDTRNGKIHSFYNSKGRIYAKPAEQSLQRKIIGSPCLTPNCMLDGMAECTIGEEHSHAFVVNSENIKFEAFRAATNEKIDSNQIIQYKCAQEYLDTSSSWNEYNSEELEQGLYVFRISVAHYYTEVKCYVLPDDAEIAFYSASTPYMIKFKRFVNVSLVGLDGVPSTNKNDVIDFRIPNKNYDSFDFIIGDGNGCIFLQTYHPKPQIHVYLYGREVDVNDNPLLIAYAEEIEVKYISVQSSNTFHLHEIPQVYIYLWDALTATVQGNDTQLLTSRNRIKLGGADTNGTLEVRVYTQEPPKRPNNSAKMMLLDLIDNKVYAFEDCQNRGEHDMLLFQSLRDVGYTSFYYAPRFIPKSGKNVANNVKTEKRKNRLALFAYKKTFVSDYAYRQFEIACEHKLYFAVFDSLLSMRWNSRDGVFLKIEGTKFKSNILNFLKGYLNFTADNSKELSIFGLRRLAREFLFDWRIIKKEVENAGLRQLSELYQTIINN